MKKIKAFSIILAVAMLMALLVPCMQVSAAGTNYVVYVDSTNGDNANDGLSKATAVKTIRRAITLGDSNGNEAVSKIPKFQKGDTFTIKFSGEAIYDELYTDMDIAVFFGYYTGYDHSNGKNGYHLDETYRVPLIIDGGTTASKIIFPTIYDDSFLMKTNQHYQCNDITFKNLTLETRHDDASTKKLGGYLLCAGTGIMTFDNVKFSDAGFDKTAGVVTDGIPRGWTLACDAISDKSLERVFLNTVNFFVSKGKEITQDYATLVFKNGDYSNVTVAALSYPAGYEGTADYSKMKATVKIQNGAKMGTVIGSLGDVGVNTEVIVENGAYVEKYIASGSGKAMLYGKYDTLTMTGGSIKKVVAASAGTKTIREIKLNVSGGVIGEYVKYETGASALKVTENIAAGVIGGTLTPSTPVTPSKPSTPATADTTNVVFFSVLAVVSLAGASVFAKRAFSK